MINIVLADDHKVVRQGLKALLEEESDFKIIGEAEDGIIATQTVEDLQPDILVLDLMMGGMNGLDVARQVRKRSPKTNIIILSMYSNEAYVLEALRVGVKGYIVKESNIDELVHAIREATAGRHYLGPPLSERLISTYLQKTEGTVVGPYDTLTTREREILHLAAQGSTNAEIAAKLYISRRTVEIHRTNMMRKLGLHTQTQLVRYSIERGILPPNTIEESLLQ